MQHNPFYKMHAYTKTTLLAFASLLTAVITQAQKAKSSRVENLSKVTFINPGFAYEAKTGESSTLYSQLFMNYSATFETSLDGSDIDITSYFDPALAVQYRFYYNYNRRAEAGKRVEKKSLNFVAPVFEGHLTKRPFAGSDFAEENRRMLTTIGGVWGMQRNYAGRFSLDIYAGLGYSFGKTTEYISANQTTTKTEAIPAVIAQINIGVWLGKN